MTTLESLCDLLTEDGWTKDFIRPDLYRKDGKEARPGEALRFDKLEKFIEECGLREDSDDGNQP